MAPLAAATSSASLKVFISYSRRDMEIADRMVKALEEAGFSVTIDRRDLPYGEEWQKELADFIRASDTVIWLVSPHSLASRWCNWELGEVQRINKRMIPVAVDLVSPDVLPETLGRLHVLPAEGAFDLERHFTALTTALESDRGWIKEHTRLADRARQWVERARPGALLLRGVALKDAQAWVDAKPRAAPAPSEDVLELLLASRRAQGRRQRWMAIGSIGFAIIGLGLASFAFLQRGAALTQERAARDNAARAIRERDAALVTQSRFLARLAGEQIERGDYGTALALAIEAMPHYASAKNRPVVPEAEEALAGAVNLLREQRIVSKHRGNIRSAAYSLGGRLIATIAPDLVRLIDAASGQTISELSFGGRIVLPGPAVFSPDGSRLLFTANRAVILWRVADHPNAAVGLIHESAVNSAAFSPDNRLVVTTSDDGAVRLWNLADTKAPHHVLRGHGDAVDRAAFSPDGRFVATASKDNTVRLWNVAAGAAAATLQGHRAKVLALAFTPDSARVVTGDFDGAVHMWDLRGRRLATFTGHQKGVWGIAFFPDGKRFATHSSDGTARIWSIDGGRPLLTLSGHSSGLASLDIAADGSRLVTMDTQAIHLWDTSTGERLESFRGHRTVSGMSTVVFSPDGKTLLSAGDTTARTWDARGGDVLRGHKVEVTAAAFAPSGDRIVTGAEDGTIGVWDANSGKRLLAVAGPAGRINTVSFAPDGTRFVTSSERGPATIWNATDGARIRTLSGPSTYHAAFHPDGKRVLTASNAGVQIWDLASGRELLKLDARHAAFSPDGTRIAASSQREEVTIRDLASGAVSATIQLETPISVLAFTPSGESLLVLGDMFGSIFDTATGTKVADLDFAHHQLRRARLHSPTFRTVAVTPDGTQIVTGSEIGSIKVWNSIGTELTPPHGGLNASPFAALSPDGTRVVGRWNDNTARIWRLFPDTQAMMGHALRIAPRELDENQRKEFFLD